MSNEIIFYTQLASIFTFVVVLFVLYRLLVSQKDSTIELLREKNQYLGDQLAEAKSLSPDVLAENLAKRVKLLIEEIGHLNQDKDKNERLIEQKENALHALQKKLSQLQEQIKRTEEVMQDFVCPYCGAPMQTREYYPIYGHIEGREVEGESEFVTYGCGLAIRDGEEIELCPSLLGDEESP
ncbi:MAG TPA: hypothetical protein VK138_07365 [Acidiferrobacterales bacterium]|nr:hypothetical protein [Acidiferrobacterales bacterium]